MKQDPQAGFNVETLQICILDLIEAGTESAATTLRWGLVFILKYPDVQSWCLGNDSLLYMHAWSGRTYDCASPLRESPGGD